MFWFQTRMADSRDMTVMHQMFRRECAAIAGLVRGVPAGDPAKVAVIANHVTWLLTFLHVHSAAEDKMVWPRLLERVPAGTGPLARAKEAQDQDQGLNKAMDDLAAKVADWRGSSAAPQRDAVAGAAADLSALVNEHFDLEEREVLPLIDKYLSEKEWDRVSGSGMKRMSFAHVQMAFGMILHETTPGQREIMRNVLPRVPWTVYSFLGPRAYVANAASLRAASGSVPVVPAAEAPAVVITCSASPCSRPSGRRRCS